MKSETLCDHIENPSAHDERKMGKCTNPAHWHFVVKGIARTTYNLCDYHGLRSMRTLKRGTLEWSASPIRQPNKEALCST